MSHAEIETLDDAANGPRTIRRLLFEFGALDRAAADEGVRIVRRPR